MLKMFMTQLTGLFQRIYDKEEFSIEDGARLLAQAAVGEGTIYIKSYNEMAAVTTEALEGPEPLLFSKPFLNIEEVMDTDRVLIITRYSNDKEAVLLGKQLREKGILFTVIAGKVNQEEEDLSELADVFINTLIIKGLLPSETGERIAFPASMAALFIYYGLKFAMDEMMSEDE